MNVLFGWDNLLFKKEIKFPELKKIQSLLYWFQMTTSFGNECLLHSSIDVKPN